MKGQFKNVFKQSAIYSVGNLASKLIGFVLLPLYADHLSISDYGMLGLLEAIAAILIAVLSLRIPTAMIRWCSETEEQEEQQSILFTSFLSLFIIVFLLNLLLQPFSGFFATSFFEKMDFDIYFHLLFFSVGFEILNKIPLEFLRFKEKAKLFITINLTKLAIILGLNIYLIAYLNLGIEGILISQIVGNAFVLLMISPYLFSNFTYRFNKVAVKGMAAYGFPLVFSTLSAMLLSLTDRFILPYFHEYGDLGVYNLGYKIAGVTNVFIISSFQLGFLPIAFKRYKEPDFKPFLSKVMTYFACLVVFFTLGLSFFSKEVIKTFAKNVDYWDAYYIVPIIGFIFIFKAISYIFTLGLHFTKQTKYNINIVLVGLIVNIVLNILLIPKYDIYGAIIASILSSLVTLYYSFRLSMRFFYVQYEWKKILSLIILCTLFTGILFIINPLDIIPRLIIKVLLLCSFIFILIFSKYFDKDEMAFASRMFKKIRQRIAN